MAQARSFAKLLSITVLIAACSSAAPGSDGGADATAPDGGGGDGASGGCADGVKCLDAPVFSDNTCDGAKGACGCTAQGLVSCASGFVVSGCACGGSCSTEGSYCRSCGGVGYRTCKCTSGSWVVSHGAVCVTDGGGD